MSEQTSGAAAAGPGEAAVPVPREEPATVMTPAAPPPFEPMPPPRAAAYMGASLLLALTQGFGMNLVTVNITQIGGDLGATTVEATWLVAAYMAPNVSLSLALVKIRMQFGLRNFAEASILVFVAAALLNLSVGDLSSALGVRFLSGIAAAPLSTLGFLYMLEPFPPARKMTVGISLALTNTALASPLARIVSPALLDIDGWHGLTVFELGLAMSAFAAVYLLPLKTPPRAKVIEALDVLSYLLIAVGFGACAVVLAVGRLYWWFEAPWLGVLLALSIAAVTAAVAIELNRKNPLIDIRWLASPPVLHFTGALLVFRLVLTEQTTGASGLFQVLGLLNDQTLVLYGAIFTATLAGGLVCAAVLKPGREPPIHAAALTLLAAGAFMDAQGTNLTRPAQMLLSQAMIAFAGALFLPPALASGLSAALRKGPNYILSFIVIFLSTQSLGGLLGSALLGSFITVREKFHSNMLSEHLALTDPIVAQRVAQLGQAYGRVLTDKALLNAEGVALLGTQTTREANVLAYNDLFLAVAILAASALAALLVHMLVTALAARRASRSASVQAASA